MGSFKGPKEGVDFFNMDNPSRSWRAPLGESGHFLYEETDFTWDAESESLNYLYGAAQVELTVPFDGDSGGFFGHVGHGYRIYIELNGVRVLSDEWRSNNIKDQDLRAAAELGLRAWQFQLPKSQSDALAALKKHP
jgi:hypothetical protein